MENKRVYGIHATQSSLRSAAAKRLYVKQGKESSRLASLIELATGLGCPVERVSTEELSRLCEGQKSHQGVVLDIAENEFPSANLHQLLQDTAGKKLFLLLDGVTDPGNLGACLRSAATMGVHAVIAPKNASAPLNADAIKRASGGANQVPYIQVVNLGRCMEQLKAAGVWILGTVLAADQAIADIDLKENIAIVMGSEGKGLRKNTIKHCDFLARIPMVSDRLGFNVSVATGICLYEVQRQRMGRP